MKLFHNSDQNFQPFVFLYKKFSSSTYEKDVSEKAKITVEKEKILILDSEAKRISQWFP